MKTLKIRLSFLPSLLLAVAAIVFACSKDDNGKQLSDIEEFHQDITNLTVSTTDFVQAAVIYESARFDTLDIASIDGIVQDYLTAGEGFVHYFQKLLGQSSKDNKSAVANPAITCVKAVSGFFDVQGISPSMVMDISELIQSTKDTVAALNEALNQQIINENQYQELINQVRIEKSLDSVGIGFSAGMGTLGGAFTYLACGAAKVAAAPAILTVGAVGVVVGGGTYLLWSYYRGNDKDSQGNLYISSVEGVLGEPIPATLFGEDATMVIAIDGHVPILFEDFHYPDAGNMMTLEINGDELSTLDDYSDQSPDTKSGNLVEVCYWQETAIAEDCNLITFVSGNAIPPNPAPYQSVTVVGSVMPVVQGCDIHFSIVGTDGYTNSGTYQTDSNGQASFGIPGAYPGVIDKVTITANNATYVVTYVFSGGSKDEPADPTKRVR